MSRGRRLRRVEPTTTSSSGLWTLNEIADYISETKWPRGPEAPTSLTATAGNAQIVLNWTAPANTYGAITNYLVEYTPSGGSAQYVLTDSTSTSYTLTGLTNDTEYTVRVAAVNHVAGEYSVSATGTPVGATVSPNIASETYSGVTYQWLGVGTSGDKLRTNISTCWGVGNPLLWTRWQFTCTQTGYLNVEWAGHGDDAHPYYANITQVLRNGVAVDISITDRRTDTGTQDYSASQKFFVLAGDVIKFSFNTGANTMCGNGPLGFIQLWIENPNPISVPSLALGQWSGAGSAISPYLYIGASSTLPGVSPFSPRGARVFAAQSGTVYWAGHWRGVGDDDGITRVLKNGVVVVSSAVEQALASGSVSVNAGDIVQVIGQRTTFTNEGELQTCRALGANGCSGDNHTRMWFVPS